MRIDIKMSQKALERKSNKPIMEKKRRARINHCLNQLKALILETDNERSRHSKLEKADILEMTVRYLQTLRAYHVHLQQIHTQLQGSPPPPMPVAAMMQQQSPSPLHHDSPHHHHHHHQANTLQHLQAALNVQAAISGQHQQQLQLASPTETATSSSSSSSSASSTSSALSSPLALTHHSQPLPINLQHPSSAAAQLQNNYQHLSHLGLQQHHQLRAVAGGQMSPTWRPW